MEPMKISFGFSKLTKKTTILPNSLRQGQEKKVELIECLEGQSIKVKDAVEEAVKQPLIIPLKDNQKNLLDRVKEAKKREKLVEQKKEDAEDTRPDSELTADELAARQLVKEAKDRLANGNSTNNSKVSVLPISQDAPTLEGEKEPTLEDYESVPISDYGFALLRGMGWKEGTAIGKNSSTSAAISVPELRPKGLGLGATKVVQSEMPAKKAVDKDGKELILAKSGFAKIIAGAQKGNYCEVQGFDEEAGRVIVKVYPKGEIVNINEFMLVPVIKEEFSKGSKILNNAKYEVYKIISDKNLDSYKTKSEHSDSKSIKKQVRNSRSSSEEDKTRSRNSGRTQNDDRKKRYESESPQREYEKSRGSKYRESSKSPSKQRESRNSDRDYNRKNKDKKGSRSRSRSDDKSKSRSSSKYKSRKDHSDSSALSDDEEYHKKNRKKGNEKGKSRYRSRSRSPSKSSSKKDKIKPYSSDEDYYEKDKKSKKHTKSKNRDRNRSESRDNKHKKNKKHSSRRPDSSESESDYKKEKRKKNKCKSRHRRNSSSGSEDRKYRSKR